MSELMLPPALRAGDAIRVVAPSSPFDRELFFRGVSWLMQRYRVEIAPHTLERAGFLAGSDAQRLADLNSALRAPELRAIVAARGGYGALRIAHLADWSALAANPKWLVGFSDVTLLHLEANGAGVCSLHAENAAGLGRADESARSAWIAALEQPSAPLSLIGNEVIAPGFAEGVLFGGNLTMLFTAQAAGRLRVPRGALLLIEDVTEASYRVDRMLTALLVSGALDGVSGVAVGDFTDCPAGPHQVPIADVLRERLAQLGKPVVAGFGVGHGAANAPIALGRRARLDSESRSLTLP